MTRAYDQLVDFIADCRPKELMDFQPTNEMRERITYLLGQLKGDRITAEESAELDTYRSLEHIMRLAKARARYDALHMSSYVSAALR